MPHPGGVALKATADLIPKNAEAVLTLPANADWKGGSVTVESSVDLPEITPRNNRVELWIPRSESDLEAGVG